MTDFNLQMLTSGVGVLTGAGGRVGFPNYPEFKLVKRYLYGRLDGNDNVTNGEIELFIDSELDVIQSWLDKVREPTYHFRVFQKSYGGKLAVLAGVGTWWGIPNPDYLNLLRARQIVSRNITMIPSENEWSFYQNLYGLSEANDNAIVEDLKKIQPTEARTLALQAKAAAIPDKMEGVPDGITPSAN